MLIGQTNDVTFKVNVMGTSADPKVKLVLNTTPEMSFPANKTGDSWHAALNIPENVQPGSYSLRVEVLVGNRHFSPMSKIVELVGATQNPEIEAVEEASPPAAEEVIAAPVEEAIPAETVVEIPAVVPAPVAPRAKKMVTLPADLFKAENLYTPTAPVVVERKPIIARDHAHAPMSAPVKVTESTKKKPTKKIELQHTLPTRLVKGKIIYE